MKRNYGIVAFLLVAAGILGAVLLNLPQLAWLLGLLFFCGAGVAGLVLNRSRVLPGVLVLGLFCGGGLWMAHIRKDYRDDLHHNQSCDSQPVTVRGVVIERPEEGLNSWRFTVVLKAAPGAALRGKIAIFCKTAMVGWYGHCWQFSGTYHSFGEVSGFPTSDERRGCTGRIYLSQPPLPAKGESGLAAPYLWAERARKGLMRAGRRFLSRENAGLLHAMVYGAGLGNDPTARALLKNLRRTGTIHLLSVSGLHIGFATAGLLLLLGVLKVPRRFQIVPLALVTVFYILMTGMEPPVMRAGMMMLLYLGGQFLNIRDRSLNRLGLAAAILLFINPEDLFEVGFQLSVLATFGVVWLAPLLGSQIRCRLKAVNLIGKSVIMSVEAQLMLLPLLIAYFQQISWVSPLLNLLLLAPAWLAVVGGLTAEGIGTLLPFGGRCLFYPVQVSLDLIRWMTGWFGMQPWAAGWSPVWPWPWFAAYYVALWLFLDWLRPNLISEKRMPVNWCALGLGILLGLNLILWARLYWVTQPKYLEVAMLDVGQGDALLLRTPDGKTALVDGGPPGQGFYRVLPYLREKGIAQLNLIIITHGHSDHWGGVPEVLEEVPAERVVASANTIQLLRRTLAARGIVARCAFTAYKEGLLFLLGKDVTLQITQAPIRENENERSLVSVANFGRNRLLLTGDLGGKGETFITRKNPALLRAAVLKVGHHGSNQTAGLPFLTQVHPQVALISVGAGNRFGHPGARTLSRLHSLGARVYRTDLAGTVTVRLYREKTNVLVRR